MPVSGRIRIPLSIENVLKRVSEYDVYRFYIGRDFVIGATIFSPFRRESNPSFSVIVGKDNRLHHMDYGDSNFSGDCINFVCQLFNIKPAQALMKIDHDFNLGITSPSERRGNPTEFQRVEVTAQPIIKERSIIQVVSRRFDEAELAYWKSYHITPKMLRDHDVYAIKRLFLNKKRYPLRIDLCFGYLFHVGDEEKWKIYWPERSKTEKWLSNVPFDHMSGMENIKAGDKNVVITKAKKDEMVLSLFLPKVASVQAENIYAISPENLAILRECPESFINFDNDETGVKASKYFNQYGLGYINCPKGYKIPNKKKEITDFSDLARYYGIEVPMAYFRRKGFIF